MKVHLLAGSELKLEFHCYQKEKFSSEVAPGDLEDLQTASIGVGHASPFPVIHRPQSHYPPTFGDSVGEVFSFPWTKKV